MFNKKQLTKLMIPLIIEQILAVLVGMADVMMVASVGENAVSGVSLVDSVNMIIIALLAALATGGAVVCSQYTGADDRTSACNSANQLILVTFVISTSLAVLAICFNRNFLSLTFGNVDKDIMSNAVIYFYITALSYPFLGIYNACAAIYRAMGDSKTSMYTSILMNIINVSGNALCIFVLKLGVAGVAIPTLISRIIAAVIMIYIIRKPTNYIYINPQFKLGYDPKTIKHILKIGIPNGLENSLFHIAKLILQTLVSSLGSTAIAAYAVSNNIAMLEYIPGNAIGIGLITIVGQCIGAKEYKQAKKYTKDFIIINYIIVAIISSLLLIFKNQAVGLYNLSNNTFILTEKLLTIHCFAMVFWPLSFPLACALRATSDVKFTMYVAVLSVWVFRIGLSYVLIKIFNFDLMGIWYAMFTDWAVRAILFTPRFFGSKWQKKIMAQAK